MLNLVTDEQIQQMINEINEYEKLNGEDEVSLLARANLLNQIQDYTGAKDLLLIAYKMDALNIDVLYSLGTIYEKLGDLAKSIVFYGLATKQMEIQGVKEDYETMLSEFSSESKLGNKLFKTILTQDKSIFIFVSTCAFSGVKQRYQNLAVALVELGHEVIYLNPIVKVNSENTFSREDAVAYVFQNERIMEGVRVLQPIFINNLNTYRDIILRLTDLYPNSNLIVSNVSISNILEENDLEQKIIFDCADDNSDFKNAFWTSQEFYNCEKQLLKRADIVITSSVTLFLKKHLLENKESVYLSKNAVSAEELGIGTDAIIPRDLEDIPEPRVGYIGVIYQRFDRELFYSLAKNNPNISFVIVGGIIDNWVTKKYPNIYILGLKPHNMLHHYYKHMDVCIIPYKDDAKMSMSCDPVKIYEHICCNVPTITTYMPDTAIDKPLVYHANTQQGFQKHLDMLLSKKLLMKKIDLERYLLENSWISRAASLVRIVQDKLFKEDETAYTLRDLQRELLDLSQIHNNYSVLYGLSNFRDNRELAKIYIERACKEDPTDFNLELKEIVNR